MIIAIISLFLEEIIISIPAHASMEYQAFLNENNFKDRGAHRVQTTMSICVATLLHTLPAHMTEPTNQHASRHLHQITTGVG